MKVVRLTVTHCLDCPFFIRDDGAGGTACQGRGSTENPWGMGRYDLSLTRSPPPAPKNCPLRELPVLVEMK